jgi:hypothetical protein
MYCLVVWRDDPQKPAGITSVATEIWMEHLPNMSQDNHCYVNPFGEKLFYT